MKVYIAGKVTGLDKTTVLSKFYESGKQLKKKRTRRNVPSRSRLERGL